MNRFFLQLTAQAENLIYGHLQILANECGFTNPPFLNGHLQHGWNGSDVFSTTALSRIRAKKYVWSTRVAENIATGKGKNFIAVGAPWLYLLRQQKVELENHFSSDGVIAYPDHSQPWEILNNIHPEYSEYLKKSFGKVTVSLHWTDYSNINVRKSYEKLGHQVITNGVGTPWLPNFNTNYLKDQLTYLSNNNTFVSNSINTAAFYASSLGLDVIIGGPAGWTDKLDTKRYYGNFGLDYWKQKLTDKKIRSALWKDELGFRHLLDKKSLRKTLEWESPSYGSSVKFISQRIQDILLNGDYKEKLSFIRK